MDQRPAGCVLLNTAVDNEFPDGVSLYVGSEGTLEVDYLDGSTGSTVTFITGYHPPLVTKVAAGGSASSVVAIPRGGGNI